MGMVSEGSLSSEENGPKNSESSRGEGEHIENHPQVSKYLVVFSEQRQRVTYQRQGIESKQLQRRFAETAKTHSFPL
jgi:hypothetical protein